MAKLQPLTARQREVYEYIAFYLKAHGFAPTLAEICHGIGVSALATVYKHLTGLERRGYLRRQRHQARSIVLLCDVRAREQRCGNF